MFSDRREQVLRALGDSAAAVLPSTPVYLRNGDVEHEYRPHSDLYWLTGFAEPEAVLVLLPGHAEHPVVMFVRPRDPEREVWDGPRAGVEGAVRDYGASVAYPYAELDQRLPGLLADRTALHYALGEDRGFDDRVLRAVAAVRRRDRRGVRWPAHIVEPGEVLHEVRLRKSPGEVAAMRRAAEITREGFRQAYAMAQPGRWEYEVEATLRAAFRARGSERVAYAPVVGSGPNACVLHYAANSRQMRDGDLLLIDAGAEWGGYACDVTRTFPINGRFSPAQRAIGQLVLDAQRAAIAVVRPGATLDDVHAAAVQTLTEGLLRLGLLQGELDAVVKDQGYKPFFMHGTSHWLGLDVHDVGRYSVEGRPRPLEPGFVLTVEPGLYFAPDDARVPPEYRGIGVRIEDDVAVTACGAEVLTHDIPKSPDDLEALLGGGGR